MRIHIGTVMLAIRGLTPYTGKTYCRSFIRLRPNESLNELVDRGRGANGDTNNLR